MAGRCADHGTAYTLGVSPTRHERPKIKARKVDDKSTGLCVGIPLTGTVTCVNCFGIKDFPLMSEE